MLQKLGIAPGFNKQVSDTGAEGQWIDGDNVRFRYGSPEKIGGCIQLGGDKLTGAARALHHWDNNAGLKYAAIGTNRILYAFSGGAFYDIHPIRLTLTSCTFASNGSTTVTVTCSAVHDLKDDDIVLFSNTTIPGGSSLSAATFNDVKFMVTSVPTSTTFTITLPANVTGTTLASGNTSTTIQIYYSVGPAQQVSGFGFGTGLFGGTSPGPATSTLATALTDTTTTNIVLASSNSFPASGTIRIGTEDISYTANNTGTNTLSGGARNVNGTTASTHSQNDLVTNVSLFIGWGQASTVASSPFDPGLWVLDNYGSKLIALIYNNECFEWDAAAAAATSTRATIIANAPTASRHVLVSTPDRHLVFFGTETTIGDKNSQDDMFIRFSDQEELNEYTVKAENTAGTQRLAAGSKIMGASKGRDAIYIWTDTALFLMQFVGQPFTFAFSQVGNNCGLLGKNASSEVDGVAYWMSENGFFVYDGQLRSMPCLVEDYVFDDLNTIPRDLIYAGTNNLFGEISWFYPTLVSNVVDRNVTYNYLDSTTQRPVWTTGNLARTTWQDSAVFDKPHATKYNASDNSDDVVGNTEGSSIYFKQETGKDEATNSGTTTIAATITSGDFDITQKRSSSGAVAGMPDIRGDGEYIMRISRFIPDFISQTGAAQISFVTKDYANSTGVTTNFTNVTENTLKKDIRLRARSIAVKVSNTGVGEDWKLGTFRLDIHPGGRR